MDKCSADKSPADICPVDISPAQKWQNGHLLTILSDFQGIIGLHEMVDMQENRSSSDL